MGGYGVLIALFFAAIAYVILLIVNPIIAPKGKRLLTILLTLFILPLVTIGAFFFFEEGLGGDLIRNIYMAELSRSDLEAYFVLGIFALFGLILIAYAIYLRVNHNANFVAQTGNARNSNFSPAKTAAIIIGLDLLYSSGRTFFYAFQSNVAETLFKFYATPMGILSLALIGLNGVACVALWQHKDWSWWLAIILSIVPFGFLFFNGFEQFRTGMLPLSYLLTFIPSIVVIVLLLLPKTRQLCNIEI